MTSSRTWPLSLALPWLIGVALRLAILAVPPAIPALREEFGLTGIEIGALSGTPIVIFAVASLAGSRLVARIGVIAAVTAGLLLAALGSATRSLAFSTVSLFAATVAMGMGVAVAQPAMPALVGRWLPKRLVLGTTLGRAHRRHRCADICAGATRGDRGSPPSPGTVVARLAGLGRLAAWSDLRRCRAPLFRHQRVLARLSE